MKSNIYHIFVFSFLCVCGSIFAAKNNDIPTLKEAFRSPPASSRPGVYWYFMDGNLSKEGITADLESMKKAGIGHVLFLEVNVGVPRGKINFLSEEWQELFVHGVKETERLGLALTLGSGPGWAGSGGPWIKPEQSMRHLVASDTVITGGKKFSGLLAVPENRRPFFGEGALTPELKEIRDAYYEDVTVLAFPTPQTGERIEDIDEKAIYYRAPYSSAENVKPYLPSLATYPEMEGIDIDRIIDITDRMDKNGLLCWDMPAGEWTIMRFGMRNNGAVTRPAPMPGLGFEADKLDTTSFNIHFDAYMGKLLDRLGERDHNLKAGWTMIHIDSWEMGAQNWTDHFRKEFTKRRSYDPLKYLPVYTGKIVENLEISERFLWDVRQTAMELVLENHATHFRNIGERYGMSLSIEPYDMNPSSDLALGAVAQMPMCEYWTKGHGFNTSYSCIEGTSIAHVYGYPVVGAEAFTADHTEAWQMYPGNVKNQGDWAFCLGINKLVYHTFAHQPLDEKLKPGMTMGPYGVHWDRGQTWWEMSTAYHTYVTRCQHVLRQGRMISDILYLTPEGAPHVFRAPGSALEGDEFLPDKRGYNFDGCSPIAFMERADVEDNQIVFPNGTSYRLLVLPLTETMTPELLQKIETLIKKGAVVIGNAPVKSPSLMDYPACDNRLAALAKLLWGEYTTISPTEKEISYGKGKIYTGGKYAQAENGGLYPSYEVAASLLDKMNIKDDFISETGQIRYTHRTTEDREIYFISNRSESFIEDVCSFRMDRGVPELWDPITGETYRIDNYSVSNGVTTIPVKLDVAQSYFIIFNKKGKDNEYNKLQAIDFNGGKVIKDLSEQWHVSFDPEWGGPADIPFKTLTDWTTHPDDGIRYYSGKAVYTKTFDMSSDMKKKELYLDLGNVKNMARVILNGQDLGIIWTFPWRVRIDPVLKNKQNQLEIEVVNLWPNRLIGDEQKPYDGPENGLWPDWLLHDSPRTSGRFTFITHNFYKRDSPLLESGLIGPVVIRGK